ncbi:MAG: T9SS type A sorting domain-containing protein [bacterium]
MNTKQKLFFVITFIISAIYISVLWEFKDVLKTKERIPGAYKSLLFWNDSRSYPASNIPSAGFYNAFVESQKLMSKNSYSGNDSWIPIGPQNFGGRTISIAINPLNPLTIYAGSASGGLWRSYTGGKGISAWQYIKTGFPVLGVGAIAIDYSDTNKIYIGTGEVYQYGNSIGGIAERPTRGSYGIGILKTTDGGNTWTKSLDWTAQQERGVQVIKINQDNASTIWAGTTEGLYKSTDSGASWKYVYGIPMITDLIINPDNPNKIYFTAGNFATTGFGCYRSIDGGINWKKISSGWPAYYEGKALLSLCETQTDIIYASVGGDYSGVLGTWLCKTTNGGDNWSVVSTTDYADYQGWFSHFVVTHSLEPDKIITGGIDIWKSNDGGITLTKKSIWSNWDLGRTPVGGPEGPDNYSHADHHCFAVHPTNPNIVYFGNDGGVFRTTDFGSTFEGLNGGYQTMQFYSGFTTSHTNPQLSMGGFQDNASAIYDGQLAWFRCIGGDGAWTAIDQFNNDILYGSWQNLSMVKSTDRGETWDYIMPPSEGTTAFAAPFVIGVDNPDIIYAARSIVYKSTDGGTRWNRTNAGFPVTSNCPITMAISFQNSAKVYLAAAPTFSNADVYKTTDGGDTWIDITGNLPDRYPMDVEVDPMDDQKVYIVFSGYGTSHVFKSINGGDTWMDISADLPDVPAQSVAVDPEHPDYIYVGNDLGVFVSADGGSTWNTFSEGLPDAVMVYNISISMAARRIRIATHGNGAYERDLFETPNSVNDEKSTPDKFILEQNYPNPFNPTTTISYYLPDNSRVILKVYDAVGKEVAELVNSVQTKGKHNVKFNAETLASGVYFYRLNSGEQVITKKMTLVK